jgi:very-short-patch-repair endonuclease
MKFRKFVFEANQNHGTTRKTITRARKLRKKMTIQEQLLWTRIRRRQILGKHFRKQHPFGFYILDFYCNEAKLGIEVDGEIHQLREVYDKQRTEYLEACGINIIRFDNKEIESEIERVIKTIEDQIVSHTETDLSPLGETGKGG